MQNFILLFSILLVASFGMYYPLSLPLFIVLSLVGMVYVLWREKQKGFKPQSDTYKELGKIKKKRIKVDNNKHKHINDQIAYIAEVWGYTKEQEKIIEKFIEGRVYSEMYNRLTASLFPQMIALIDKCNDKGQKGCKRDVSKRLRELTELMKAELKKQKSQKVESLETTLEVYDQLLREIM